MVERYRVNILETSQTGWSVLVIRKPSDHRLLPSASCQVPTEVAEWIKSLASLEDYLVEHFLVRFNIGDIHA